MPETKKSPKGISPKKLSDLKVVVLCIAAATTFWILNALNKDDYTTIVDFPVTLIYDEEDYVPIKRLPESIQIQISGNGWDLLRKYFNINNAPYPIELSNPASRNFVLTSDLKRSLGEFLTPTQLISVLDDSLVYSIDRLKTIQVKPVLDSSSYSLATNYRVMEDVVFEPKEITLTGPSSILDSLGGSFPIQLGESRINKDVKKDVRLRLSDELDGLVSIKESSITVNLDVVAFLEGNKRLKINKVNFPRTVSLQNEEVSIMMYYLVDERSLTDLREVEFEAELDYYKRNKEDSTITVKVNPLPKYLDQVRVEPAAVKLNYE